MYTFFKVLHVLGAVALFGPSFTFPILGMLGEKGIMDPKSTIKGIQAIAKKLLIAGDIVMPVTGALMIWKGGWYHLLPHKEGHWLGLSIVLFLIMVGLANAIQMPTVNKAAALADGGNIGPEFGALIGRSKKIGPVLGILLVAIIVLMVWKPLF